MRSSSKEAGGILNPAKDNPFDEIIAESMVKG